MLSLSLSLCCCLPSLLSCLCAALLCRQANLATVHQTAALQAHDANLLATQTATAAATAAVTAALQHHPFNTHMATQVTMVTGEVTMVNICNHGI